MKNRNKGTLREKEKAEEAIRVEGKTSTKVRVVEIWDGEFVREIATCESLEAFLKHRPNPGRKEAVFVRTKADPRGSYVLVRDYQRQIKEAQAKKK